MTTTREAARRRTLCLGVVAGTALLLAACAPTLDGGTPEPSGATTPPPLGGQPSDVTATWPVPVLEVIDLFQEGSSFYQQSAKGSVSFDRDEYLFGQGSFRLTVGGADGQLNLRSDAVGTLDLSRRNLVLWLRVSGLADLASVSVYVGSRDMAEYAVYTAAAGGGGTNERYSDDGEWHAITLNLGDPRSGSGHLDLGAVESLQVSVVARSDAEVVVHVNGLATTPRPARGAVTIMFDDARESVYHLGLPVLDALDLPATVSVIADLAAVPGFMTVSQLRELQDAYGWEIVAHHRTALTAERSFDLLTPDELVAELAGVRSWMLDNGLTSGIDAISYPHGGIDVPARAIVGRYFDNGRTVVRGVGLETSPPADPLRLRAYVVRDVDPVTDLLALVDRAAASGGWLVLVFHQLSVDAPAFQTAYRLDDFATVMTHVATSDLDIVPLGR